MLLKWFRLCYPYRKSVIKIQIGKIARFSIHSPMSIAFITSIRVCLLTFALLGPSIDKDSSGPDAFLADMVKTHGSPHFPVDRPGP